MKWKIITDVKVEFNGSINGGLGLVELIWRKTGSSTVVASILKLN